MWGWRAEDREGRKNSLPRCIMHELTPSRTLLVSSASPSVVKPSTCYNHTGRSPHSGAKQSYPSFVVLWFRVKPSYASSSLFREKLSLPSEDANVLSRCSPSYCVNFISSIPHQPSVHSCTAAFRMAGFKSAVFWWSLIVQPNKNFNGKKQRQNKTNYEQDRIMTNKLKRKICRLRFIVSQRYGVIVHFFFK